MTGTELYKDLGISNLKDNSYNVTVDGEKYHITIEKGKKYFIEAPNEMFGIHGHSFFLKAETENNSSFCIKFTYETVPLLRFNDAELHSYSADFAKAPDIDVKDFYEKAFASHFGVRMPPRDGICDEGGKLYDNFCSGIFDFTLEDLVKQYQNAKNIYDAEEKYCMNHFAEYLAGLRPFEARRDAIAEEIAKLEQERKEVEQQIYDYNKPYPKVLASCAKILKSDENPTRKLTPMEISLLDMYQKKR
ncbi:MAG: hypothetical protein IKD08_04840 [Alphaproteobacteria bacterium]|nr:hypothetical protein [Alphaproteobacteria bacterium]